MSCYLLVTKGVDGAFGTTATQKAEPTSLIQVITLLAAVTKQTCVALVTLTLSC